MRFEKARQTWRGMTLEAWLMRVAIGALILINGTLVFLMTQVERTIVFAPPVVDEEFYVTKSDASQSYWEMWSYTIATQIGNITPGNVEFILERLKEIAAPESYRSIVDTAYQQLNELRSQGVSMAFEPNTVVYDPRQEVYRILGRQHMWTISGRRTTRSMAFEFKWRLDNYRPRLTYISAYDIAADAASQAQQLQNTN